MEERYKLYEMFGNKLFKKLFKKDLKEVVIVNVTVVADAVVADAVEDKVFEKEFVYKKKEIDLNNIDFPISPRFQIFLDMVRNE